MDTLGLGFLYFGNSLRSIKRGSGCFLQTKGSFKDVFSVRSIRVFSQVLLDPYYEPLPWFMFFKTRQKVDGLAIALQPPKETCE